MPGGDRGRASGTIGEEGARQGGGRSGGEWRRHNRPGDIQGALDLAVRQMGFDGGVVYSISKDDRGGGLSMVGAKGIDRRTRELLSTLGPGDSHTLGQGPGNIATRSVSELPKDDSGASAMGRALREVGMKYVTSLPLSRDGDVLGALELLSRSERTPTAPEVSMIQLIGSHMANVLHAKRLEGKLGRAGGRVDIVGEAMDDGVYRVDAAGGRFLSVNDAMEKLTGYPRDIFMESSVTDWGKAAVHPDDLETFLSGWKDLPSRQGGEGEMVHDTKYRLVDKDGTVHEVSDRRVMITDAGGELSEVLGVIRDLTPELALTADFRQRNMELELLFKVSLTIQEDLEPGPMGERLVGAILEGTGYDTVAMWVPPDGGGEEGDDWRLLAAKPTDGYLTRPGAWKSGAQLKEAVFGHTGDDGGGGQWGGKVPGTVCSMPCTHMGRGRGLILLGSSERSEPGGNELRLLTMLGREIALAIENRERRLDSARYSELLEEVGDDGPALLAKLEAAGVDTVCIDELLTLREAEGARLEERRKLEDTLGRVEADLSLHARLNNAHTMEDVLQGGLDEIVGWGNISAPAAILSTRPGTEGLQVSVDRGFFTYGPGQDGLPAPHKGCPKDMADFISGLLRTEAPVLPQYTIAFISTDRDYFAFNLRFEGKPYAIGVAHHTGNMSELSALGARLDRLGETLGPAYARMKDLHSSSGVARNIARFNHFAVGIASDLDPSRIFELTLATLNEGAFFDAAIAVLLPHIGRGGDGGPDSLTTAGGGQGAGPDVEHIPLKKDSLKSMPEDRGAFTDACSALTRTSLAEGRGILMRTLRGTAADSAEASLHREGYRSAATVPLSVDGRRIGALVMLSRHSGGLGTEELHFFEGVARFAAPALEKSRTMARLREKGFSLDRLLDSTPEMWMIIDPAGRPTRVSASSRLITGRPAQEFMDGSVDLPSVAHADDRSQVEKHIAMARLGNGVPELEFRVVMPDGSASWVLMTLRPLDATLDSGSTVLAVLSDIGPFKEREAGLEAVARHLEGTNRQLQEVLSWWEERLCTTDHEAFLSSVLSHAMKDGGYNLGCVYSSTDDGKGLRVVVWEGLLGPSPDLMPIVPLTAEGSGLSDLLSRRDVVPHAMLAGLRTPVLGTKTPEELKDTLLVPLKCADTLVGMLSLARSPDMVGGGDAGGVMMVAPALGKVLAMAIEDHQRQTDSARELLGAREEMVFYSDKVTHDLHNLNTGALGYLEMAMGPGLDPDRKERYLRRAFSQIVRSSVLVENVKKLGRDEGAGDAMDVDLDSAIRGSVANMLSRYPDRSLVPKYVPVPATVRARRDAVEEILLNILDNTVKYSSTPDVPVEFDVDPLAGDGFVALTIRDRGGPLPPGQDDEFSGRLPQGARVPEPGQLGRYLAGSLLRGMGGDIRVGTIEEDGDPVGTEYVLRFPRGGVR